MHLLHFANEAAARSRLGERFDAALPTALVTADAVYDEDGEIITPRQTLPGFWLLCAEPGLPNIVATLGPAGIISTEADEIIGARLDPIYAGMPDGPLAMAPESELLDPVPEVISDRQFAQQLAILGTITEAEAIAWAARGDLPEALEQAIATLPIEGGVRFSARMLLSSATTYERSHPMTATLGAILGYDAGALDDLWRAAAAL